MNSGGSDVFAVRGDGLTTVFGNMIVGSSLSDSLTIKSAILGASPLVLEGGTVDAYKMTIAVDTLTASQVITLPDQTGTVVLSNGYLENGRIPFVQNNILTTSADLTFDGIQVCAFGGVSPLPPRHVCPVLLCSCT